MIRVLHVISSLEIGGAQRLTSDLLPELKEEGVEVSLLVNRRLFNEFEDNLERANIEILSINSKKNFNISLIWTILKLKNKYDIIHAHLFPALYLVAIAGAIGGTKLVYTEHSTTNRRRHHRIFKWIEKCVYHKYNIVVSVSEDVQINIKKWLNVSSPNNVKFVVIQNGINCNSFVRERMKGDYDVTLLMVSRFSEAKDQTTVIKAMQYLPSYVHVVFIGDGVTKRKCEQDADQLHVNDRVHFLGVQSDIPYWISRSDIGLLSTRWEGLPLSALEMMAGGLPVLASDVDGVRQVVDGAGVLFPQGDERALAASINHMIEDKNYYHQISEKCFNRAKLYDIKNMVQQYVSVYKRLIK